MTENHGVPGSNPGPATQESPAKREEPNRLRTFAAEVAHRLGERSERGPETQRKAGPTHIPDTTFIKFKGEISAEAPPFAALVQALLIRIPMLSAVHCGEIWREDFKALVERAGKVKTVRDETTWISFRRYSSFKKKSEPLGGVVGRAEYAGSIEEFLPLLEMGQ